MNVALIIFNRPDLTERVLSGIVAAKPSKLFVIADGPRPGVPGDLESCMAARDVIDRVDWDCDVIKNYSDVNLGCGLRPATGISWVFEQVEYAIILEDDCVPHPSFFPFCDEMLQRYADDERMVQVCGNLHHFGGPRGGASYFFSRHNLCAGGWATWRRAWRHFDFKIELWPSLRETPWLRYVTGHHQAANYWERLFDAAHAGAGHVDFWDYQWTFACWIQNGLSIVPNTGLLTNMGFRPDGTHTKGPDRWANLPVAEMMFPLNHPPCVVPDSAADLFFVEQVAGGGPPSFSQRLRRKLSRHTPGPVRRLFSKVKPRRDPGETGVSQSNAV